MSKTEANTNPKNQISLNLELYTEVADIAKQHNKTPQDMAVDLLNAQVWKAQHEQLFYPGLQWDKPKATIIVTRMLEADMDRLQKWQENKETISIVPVSSKEYNQGGTSEVWLIKEELTKKTVSLDSETYQTLKEHATKEGLDTVEEYLQLITGLIDLSSLFENINIAHLKQQ